MFWIQRYIPQGFRVHHTMAAAPLSDTKKRRLEMLHTPQTPNNKQSALKKGRLEALERRQSDCGSSSAIRSTTPNAKTPLSGLKRRDTPIQQDRRRLSSTPNLGLREDDPTYSTLCQSIFDGELGAHLQLAKTGAEQVVSGMLRELWLNNSKAMKDIEGTMDKAQNQLVLLDNPTTHQMASDKARARAQQSSTRSVKHMSLTQHRKYGSFHLDREYRRYELYVPLHDMWREYAKRLTAGCNDAMMQSRLLTSDLHGAILEVVDSKNKSFIGTKGIMIRETENTFGIITSSNNFRVIPKAASIFMFQLETIRVTLFGNNLSLRTMQSNNKRVTKKKLKSTIEL